MLYPYCCDNETCSSFGKEFTIPKHHSLSSRGERCSVCGEEAIRIYTFERLDEFKPFFDEQYNCTISCRRQEAQLMKQNGHIDAHDFCRKKFGAYVKNARWKAKHSHTIRFGKCA